MPRIDTLGLPIGKLKDPGKPDRRRRCMSRTGSTSDSFCAEIVSGTIHVR